MSEYIVDMSNSSYQSTSGLLCADISQLREEIVRCKDCASFREKDWRCTAFQWRNCDGSPDVEPNGFCAWGERENDD